MTLNSNKIYLPKSVTILYRDKFTIRCIVKKELLLFHMMLKQGLTCFNLASNNPQKQYKTYKIYFQRKWLAIWLKLVIFSSATSCVLCQRTC